VAAEEFGIIRIFEAFIEAGAGLERDGSGAAEDCGKDNIYLWDSEAEIGGPPGQMRKPGGGNRSFGGRAAEVDARSSEILTLGQGYLLPGFRESARKWWASLAASDDQDVIMISHSKVGLSLGAWRALH